MASSLDHPRNSTIRRVQSTGDIPREPRPTYKSRESHHPARHSDLRDGTDPAAQGSSFSASSPTPNAAPYLSPATWTPTAIPPLEPLQTQIPSGPVVPHVPAQQQNRSFYRQSLTFLGLGRGASVARRSLMGLLFNLVSGFTQVCGIIYR